MGVVVDFEFVGWFGIVFIEYVFFYGVGDGIL